MPFSCDWVDFCLERDGSDPVYRLVTAAHGPPCSILKFVTAAAVPSPVTSACQMIFGSNSGRVCVNFHMMAYWFLLHDGIINEMIYSSSSKAGRGPVLKRGCFGSWVLCVLSTMLEDSACVCFPRQRTGSVSFGSSNLKHPLLFVHSLFLSISGWSEITVHSAPGKGEWLS